MYNAYEKDIAMLNIYFGGSTVFGKKQNKRKQRFYYCNIFPRV